MRPDAGEELVEHDSQRIHIAGCRRRFAAELLGAGVGGGERAQLGEGGGGITVAAGVHQLRNAEVEQAWATVAGDQDVARLEVAVHHAAGVRELDRLEHGDQELAAAR